MKRLVWSAAALGVALTASIAAMQKTTQIHPGGGGSPHVRAEWVIEGTNISIEYGRPYLKGRTIGQNIVQYGYVWRAERTQNKQDAWRAAEAVCLFPLPPPGTNARLVVFGDNEAAIPITVH